MPAPTRRSAISRPSGPKNIKVGVKHLRLHDADSSLLLLGDRERLLALGVVLHGVRTVRAKVVGEDRVGAVAALDRVSYFETGPVLRDLERRMHPATS